MRDLVLNKRFLQRNPVQFAVYFNKVYETLMDLNLEYKGFHKWYFQKVLDGLEAKERTLLLKEHNDKIVAISILKHAEEQCKICTFRVIDEFQRFGLGNELLKKSFDVLENNKPLITVSEKRLHQFDVFLKRNGFTLYKEYKNFYADGFSEYSFNGPIENIKEFNLAKPHKSILIH